MSRLDPRHRQKAIAIHRQAPETEIERSYFVYLHGAEELKKITPLRPWEDNCIIDPSLEYPLQLFNTESTSSILEAFLLATDNDYEIQESIAMPVDEIRVYRELFFDTKVFRTDLELIVFLQNIREDNPFKPLYRMAFNQGIGGLRWHLCRDKGDISPESVIKTIMADSFFRSLEHRGQPISAKTAREAAKYAKLSLDCAKTLVQQGNSMDNDSESLKIKFEETRQNRTLDDLVGNDAAEVMH